MIELEWDGLPSRVGLWIELAEDGLSSRVLLIELEADGLPSRVGCAGGLEVGSAVAGARGGEAADGSGSESSGSLRGVEVGFVRAGRAGD